MKNYKLVGCIGVAGLVLVTFSMVSGCNDDLAQQAASSPSATDAGGFTLACNGPNGMGPTSSQQSSQQSPFKKEPVCEKQESAQQKQTFHFKDHKVTDLVFTLDCSRRVVEVRHEGLDKVSAILPIDEEGRVTGEVRIQDQMDDDGKGHDRCFVELLVIFNGQAVCDDIDPGKDGVKMSTQIQFAQTSEAALNAAGITLPEGPVHPTPSPSPSVSPSVSPSPSPSPSASPSPRPLPSPTVIPIIFCEVDDPCPIQGDTSLSCPK